METYSKSYFLNNKSIQIFLIKGLHFSEMKFYVDGSNIYTVSNSDFDKLVESIEDNERFFEQAFSLNRHSEQLNAHDKLISLGYIKK